MGFKRPFDDGNLEFPFKHLRQSENENDLPSFAGKMDNAMQKEDVSVEGNGDIHKLNCNRMHEIDDENEVSVCAEKDVETSAPLSWVTSSSSEEDAGFGSLYPDYFEFNSREEALDPSEEDYASLLDHSPRRKVPIGPDHQAVVPLWVGHKRKLDGGELCDHGSSPSHSLESDNDGTEEQLMGTCIIPMPKLDSSFTTDEDGGVGRKRCGCLGEGSVRCVQQHIGEARKKLRGEIGEENFVRLGFYDMGEIVVSRWSEEEERLFHQLVYSNPQSLGRNFWKHLSVIFPSRTHKEIVSYYFNVFMLRRRAVQNRSKILEIDSDDDEWHGSYKGSFETKVAEEDDDSAVESPADFVEQSRFQDGFPVDDYEDYDDDGSGDDGNNDLNGDFVEQSRFQDGFPVDDYEDYDDDGDASGDDGNNDLNGVWGNGLDNTTEDGCIDHFSEGSSIKSFEDSRIDPMDQRTQHADMTARDFCDNFFVRDDSVTSFEFNIKNFYGPDNEEACRQGTRHEDDHVNLLSSRSYESVDGTSHAFMLDPCDAKVWESRCQIESVRSVDLLPTGNLIEELFGHGSRDSSPKDQ